MNHLQKTRSASNVQRFRCIGDQAAGTSGMRIDDRIIKPGRATIFWVDIIVDSSSVNEDETRSVGHSSTVQAELRVDAQQEFKAHEDVPGCLRMLEN